MTLGVVRNGVRYGRWGRVRYGAKSYVLSNSESRAKGAYGGYPDLVVEFMTGIHMKSVLVSNHIKLVETDRFRVDERT